MTCRTSRGLCVVAMIIGASGCMATEAGDVARTETAGTDIEPTRIALKSGASAGPDDIDGYCEDGAGIYLSTDGDAAELMLYVVAPAEAVTFDRPQLQLTTEEGATEVSEFESVTLIAGESRLFSERADGPLVDVTADIGADVTPQTP